MRNKLIAKSSDYIVGFIPVGVDAKGTKSTLEYARDYNKKYKIINQEKHNEDNDECGW